MLKIELIRFNPHDVITASIPDPNKQSTTPTPYPTPTPGQINPPVSGDTNANPT